MDKVSIIMPCYNDGTYIQEAINSVRKQTYKNIELIIIDDGSDDPNTLEILSKLAEQKSDVKLLKTHRLRPAGARNFGIQHAEGKYILPLDSDDIIKPEYVEKAVAILENNESVGVVYCYAELFGEKTGRWELPDYSLDKMLLDNIVFVTAMFHREDWEKVGGFNSEMHHGMEDYDFWLSIMELGREIHQIPEVLFHYRIKPTSRTTEFMVNIHSVQKTYRDIYLHHPQLYEKYRDKYAYVLREALIEQLFLNKALQESILILEKIKRIPVLKTVIKKFIMK
ncbi:glycosyltransferase family 2 protein [Paenibacillus polymyxa]|uniref:glycosyltransferase family 2 protein n=1 Tax=Paenibacillus polymyxa TaxID=1406 RepID=UPI0004D8494E|nr:glycosyltransferase family A protein [Paenibacillus polymyxa]KEO78528.1 glycosyl transferase family 2 [Paenibacillus polymyxa]MCH6188201.1 glycosyltransferase family 2 protein [Paenibacillus polymyxa]MDY8092224.1 glycosyltransferase family A protein [Paenibacillus polymyxa]WRL57667.1 glycosyltransferase family A protein [Paenibacillus polymyxa]